MKFNLIPYIFALKAVFLISNYISSSFCLLVLHINFFCAWLHNAYVLITRFICCNANVVFLFIHCMNLTSNATVALPLPFQLAHAVVKKRVNKRLYGAIFFSKYLTWFVFSWPASTYSPKLL